MKRLLGTLVLAAGLAAGFSGCGGDDSTAKPTANQALQGTPPVVNQPSVTGSPSAPTVVGASGTPVPTAAGPSPTPDAAVVAQFNALAASGPPAPPPAGVPGFKVDPAGTQRTFANGRGALAFRSADGSGSHIYHVGFVVYESEEHAEQFVKTPYASLVKGFQSTGTLPNAGLPEVSQCVTGAVDGYGQSICLIKVGHAVAIVWSATRDDAAHGDDAITKQLADLAVGHLRKSGIS